DDGKLYRQLSAVRRRVIARNGKRRTHDRTIPGADRRSDARRIAVDWLRAAGGWPKESVAATRRLKILLSSSLTGRDRETPSRPPSLLEHTQLDLPVETAEPVACPSAAPGL